MATNITEFIPGVAPAAPLCPTTVLKREIIESLRIFCDKVKIWIKETDPIDLVANTASYDLNLVNETGTANAIGTLGDIVGLEHVEINQLSLDAISERYLNSNERGWRTHTQQVPRRYFMGPERSVRLVFTPNFNNAGGMVCWVTMQPLRSATDIEDFIFDDFRLAIEYGAIALLKEIPDTPWTNAESALYYWDKFKMECDEALEKKLAGYSEYQGQIYFTPDNSYV